MKDFVKHFYVVPDTKLLVSPTVVIVASVSAVVRSSTIVAAGPFRLAPMVVMLVLVVPLVIARLTHLLVTPLLMVVVAVTVTVVAMLVMMVSAPMMRNDVVVIGPLTNAQN